MRQEFDEIYRLYARDVYRYILQMCRNEALAEDILQDTMLKAVTAIDKFNGECSMKSWLCLIAKRLYFNHLKKSESRNLPLDDAQELRGIKTAEESVVERISAVDIIRLIHDLEEPYKEIFLLRFYGELKYSEIAEVFGKSENWARVCFFRAKARLAEMIETEDLL